MQNLTSIYAGHLLLDADPNTDFIDAGLSVEEIGEIKVKLAAIAKVLLSGLPELDDTRDMVKFVDV